MTLVNVLMQILTFVFLFQSNNRIKAMRRQLDEAEEEISREKAHRRKVRRNISKFQEKIISLSILGTKRT